MTHPHSAHRGFRRVYHATRHSVAGLAAAFRHESAFRQECAAAVVMLPAAFLLGRGWVEVALLAGSVVMVLIVELLNSAVETVVDRVSPDLHPLSKRAKDIGSAAVMLALLTCAALWVAALWQRWGG